MFHVKQKVVYDRSLGLKTNKRSYIIKNNECSVVYFNYYPKKVMFYRSIGNKIGL